MRRRRRRNPPLSRGEKVVLGAAFLLGIAGAYAYLYKPPPSRSGAKPPLPPAPGGGGAGAGGGDAAPVPPSQYAAYGTGDEEMARTYQEQGGSAFSHN